MFARAWTASSPMPPRTRSDLGVVYMGPTEDALALMQSNERLAKASTRCTLCYVVTLVACGVAIVILALAAGNNDCTTTTATGVAHASLQTTQPCTIQLIDWTHGVTDISDYAVVLYDGKIYKNANYSGWLHSCHDDLFGDAPSIDETTFDPSIGANGRRLQNTATVAGAYPIPSSPGSPPPSPPPPSEGNSRVVPCTFKCQWRPPSTTDCKSIQKFCAEAAPDISCTMEGDSGAITCERFCNMMAPSRCNSE